MTGEHNAVVVFGKRETLNKVQLPRRRRKNLYVLEGCGAKSPG